MESSAIYEYLISIQSTCALELVSKDICVGIEKEVSNKLWFYFTLMVL